jgi:uncharacterized protein YbcV (DUF1398 family)
MACQDSNGGTMDTKVIDEVMRETQAGNMIFPEVVGRLIEVGLESYFVDFAGAKESFYASNGDIYTEKMSLSRERIAQEFSASELITAIRGAQADTVRYPEFVKRATAAGVIAYWAFLAGKKVIYFGRKGEMHVEEFPGAKS